MEMLYPAMCILTVCGCRRPVSWSSTWKTILYHFYTIFVVLVVHALTFTQLMDVLLNIKNPEEFTDNIYILLATTIACCKIIALLKNRRNINDLIQKLHQEPYKPMNAAEIEIRATFDKNIGNRIIQYTILVESTVVCMILSSYLINYRHGKLAYRAWLPYDFSTPGIFFASYSHQTLALIYVSLLNVACDSVICGLLMHTCSQIDILKHRLRKITPETVSELRYCVYYHIDIYRYAKLINEKFRIIIGIQFCISTLVVCINLYMLTNTPLGSKYLEFVLYMACMMTQIFIYCWYGNGLKLKSLGVISGVFDMNWMVFDTRTKRSLIMIMRRATRPIELTSAYILVMDLSTFVAILKLSYSTYNFLQTTKEEQ